MSLRQPKERAMVSIMKNLGAILFVLSIFLLALLFSGCALNEPRPEPGLSSNGEALMGDVKGNPNPLTFWWYGGNPAEIRPALECALERIREATCLPVDVSMDAHHWVTQRPPEEMGGRLGWTFGQWDSLRIALKTPMGAQSNCRVLVHEIAQHVLRRRNDHVGASLHMDAALLADICLKHDCGCMVPETADNPIESTQGECTGE